MKFTFSKVKIQLKGCSFIESCLQKNHVVYININVDLGSETSKDFCKSENVYQTITF